MNQTRSCQTHTHTHTQADFTFLLLAPPLMWPRQPRDKWARTWQTLRLAKNNMLSTDQLSRNANTKCSLFCNYLRFDMSGGGDSLLSSPVHGCLGGSRRCGERFVAALAPGRTGHIMGSVLGSRRGDVVAFQMHSMQGTLNGIGGRPAGSSFFSPPAQRDENLMESSAIPRQPFRMGEKKILCQF